MGVSFDETHYPVIIVRFPKEGPDDAIHEWYDAIERYLDEAEGPVAFVDDLRLLEPLTSTANQRQLAAGRHSRLAETRAHKHAGNARIVAGPISVAILRVFDWISPAPWPVANFAYEADAIDWSLRRIDEARAHTTPSVTESGIPERAPNGVATKSKKSG